MSKAKICFVVTDAISFNLLCRGQFEFILQNADVELTLVSGGSEEEIARLVRRKIGRFVNLGFVRRPNLVKDAIALFRLFCFFCFNRFDLVVYSTPKALLLGSMASTAAFLPQRVALIRGRVYENFVGLKRWCYATLDRISIAVSHKNVFISYSLMNTYLNDGLVSPSRSCVIGKGSSNGVSESRFKPLENFSQFREIRTSLGVDESHFVVAIVGRICIDKGIEDFSRLIDQLSEPHFRFLIVGAPEDDHATSILREIVASDGRVIHCPRNTDVAKVFSISNVHLFLTHREGFGNVAIEAAASGIPTLAYDVVGVRDSVEHNVTGIKVPFSDLEAISNCLKEAISDRDKFKSKFPQCREWVIEHYAESTVWKNYLSFYLSGAN